MSKKRIICVSKSADHVLSAFSSISHGDVEIIVEEDFAKMMDLLKHQTCALILLSPSTYGFPLPEDISEIKSVAPLTPVILVTPASENIDTTMYGEINISEIVREEELPDKFSSIVDRYLYSGFGMLREWTFEEVFDYCFPVITNLDYDTLCQTIVDLLKELLMANSGMLISLQQGRGSGYKLHSISGFDDMTKISNILGSYGEELISLCDEEPRLIEAREIFGSGKFPKMEESTGSVFTVKFEMEGMDTLLGILFLKSPPYPEVLKGEILHFFLKQARFAIYNAEKSIKVQSLIYIDDLTKLYNSRYLKVVLDRELKRSDRYGTPVSVLFLDIDYFKRVNDSYGHMVGSRVLYEFGDILSTCVRETDTVVRYGGDEFVVVLVETNPDQALLAAERMRESVEGNLFMREEGLDLSLTVSIGIASYPIHADDKDQLLQMADKAMYRGKDSTRNVVYIAGS